MKKMLFLSVFLGLAIPAFAQKDSTLAQAATSKTAGGYGSIFPTNGQNVGVGTLKPLIHSGYTGISTNSPKLGGFIDFLSNNVEEGFIFGDATSGLNLWSSKTSSGIHFFPAGSERLTILASGYMGIGTTKPLTRLDVSHPTGNVSTAIFHSNGRQASGNVLTLATDAVGDDPKILFSYENKAYTWALGGYKTDTRFSIWEGGGDGVFGKGFGTERLTVLAGGNVGIGTSTPANKLDVNGTVHSKAVTVDLNGWPDFVFLPTYQLPSLKDVDQYIKANQRLPGMPSASEVASSGLNLGEINKVLTKKVEELTLYLIDKDKQLNNQQNVIEKQQMQLDALKREMLQIENKLSDK